MADDLCVQIDNAASFPRSDHLNTFLGVDLTVVSILSMEATYPPASIPAKISMIAPSVTSSLRALVVEDSLVNQKLLSHILTRQGFDVTVAGNGEEAVEKFDQHSFDVVLMDVQMPVMDGLAATRMIRRHESGTGVHTPIIAVTAGFDRESCLQAGMDDHLYKPVRLDDLRPLLEQLVTAVSS